MKITLLLIPLFIFSCTNKKPVNESTQVSESEDNVYSYPGKAKITEIIDFEKEDSLSKIAWGDAMFGMSMKEVLKTKAFKDGSQYSESIEMPIERKEAISSSLNIKQGISTLEARFKEKMLCSVYIQSGYVSRNKLESLISDCDKFREKFIEKNGDPYREKVSIYESDFKDGEKFEYVKFMVGNKFITINFGETYINGCGFRYYYEITIDNTHFPPVDIEKLKKELQEKQKKQEEQKKVLDYSF